MLRDKFREFARDTSTIGQERVDGVNALADDLIESGHPENASVAEWKDGLNEAWADLLELIDTRTQMLAASYELHRFHQDAMEVLGRIKEKREGIPSDLGRDLNTVQHLHRQHNTFENDIQALSGQVSQLLIRRIKTSHTGGCWTSSLPRLCWFRWTRCRMMQHASRRPMLGRKLMTFTGVNKLWLLPGRVYWKLVRPAGSSCWTQWRSSASSTWCVTSCSGWTVSTCRLMHMTAPGERTFLLFVLHIYNI